MSKKEIKSKFDDYTDIVAFTDGSSIRNPGRVIYQSLTFSYRVALHVLSWVKEKRLKMETLLPK